MPPGLPTVRFLGPVGIAVYTTTPSFRSVARMFRNSGRKHDDERSQHKGGTHSVLRCLRWWPTCTEVQPNCFVSASLKSKHRTEPASYDPCDKHGHLMYAFQLPLQRDRKAPPTKTAIRIVSRVARQQTRNRLLPSRRAVSVSGLPAWVKRTQ